MSDLETLLERLNNFYRANKRALMRLEKIYMETPTDETELEIAEAKGVLRGVLKSIDVIEGRRNESELKFGDRE